MDTRIKFCRDIPKIELHAHLNGSLSVSTVQKLISLKKNTGDQQFDLSPYIQLSTSNVKSLTECFKVFHLIHQLTDTPEAVYQATYDVIEDFRRENVKYLELRSTPREVVSKMSKEEYVQAIVSAIQNYAQKESDIKVKLLLAIDRKNPVSVAIETVQLAEKYMHQYDEIVVGVDLSGDPRVGNAEVFLPALQKAKQSNLKLALHIAEVPEKDREIEALLTLPPDRIGHGTFLHLCNSGRLKAEQLKLPIEVCFTSNVVCGTVSSYKEHHFGFWKENNHPCVVCTDDKGVFGTSLSHEYWIAAENFAMSYEELWNMSYSSITYSFANNAVKEELKKIWKDRHKDIFNLL